MFFTSLPAKATFIVVASSTLYLSFERLYSDSGMVDRTNFNGWVDYVKELSSGTDKTIFKAILAIMIFTLVMVLLTLKSFLPSKSEYE